LHQLIELQKIQVDSGAAPGTRHLYIANLLRLAEARALAAEDRSGWDLVFDIYEQALKPEVKLLEGRDYKIFWAWSQMSILYFGQNGRPHYPEFQNWGDDYEYYCLCANYLGDVLAEIEESNGLDEFGDGLMEALLCAAVLTLKYAYSADYSLSTEFLDRLRSVSEALFLRIKGGSYVSISLAHAAMEAELAIVSMLYKLSTVPNETAESEISTIPGVKYYILQSRQVDGSESLQMIEQISAAVDRYRELGMLSVEMIMLFARISYDRLILIDAGASKASEVFDLIVDDAILAKDGDRAANGEPVKLLEWLVRIFDRWLVDSPNADNRWKRLRDGYGSCSDRRFDDLVVKIRV
jgi:hypothetical protein